MSETHLCPRRSEVIKPRTTEDTWEVRPNGDRCCSFCGSLHPEDFKRLLTEGAKEGSPVTIDPSTKGYKIYVRQPGVRNAGDGGIKFYTMHGLDGEWLEEVKKLYPIAVKKGFDRWTQLIE